MRKLLLLPAAAVLVGILAGAYALDCFRLTRSAAERLQAADVQLRDLELQLGRTLSVWPEATNEIQPVLERLSRAASEAERRGDVERLAAVVERMTTKESGASRRLQDEAAGLLNRRQIAWRRYLQEKDEYDAWRRTIRGRLGERLTSAAAEAGQNSP